VITIGQRKTDNINRMITTSELSDLGLLNLNLFGHINRYILLSMITLRGIYCV
jgi:hypothetical protein